MFIILSHLCLDGIFHSATVSSQYPSNFWVHLLWWEKSNVLKKAHKSGTWLYKMIIIFPVDESGEHIYLFEFQIVLYIYILHTIYIAFPLHIQCYYALLSFLCIKKTYGLVTKIWPKNKHNFIASSSSDTDCSVLQYFCTSGYLDRK